MVEQKRTLHHAYQQGNPVQTKVMCCRVLVLLYRSECWRMTEKDNPRLADGNHLTAKAMEMATGHYGIEWVICPIFMNVSFAVLYVKVNFTKCEVISCPSFCRKIVSTVLLRFKDTDFLEKSAGPTPIFLCQWIPIALAKIYYFRVVLIWPKNLCIQ